MGLEEDLRQPRLKKADIKKEDYLSTGSTLLNLACSGMPDGGLTKGRYFWMVGDSDSGKTFLTLTCFAEAAINPNFDEYDLVFDNAEDGALMDMAHFFGPKMAARIQPPSYDSEGRPVNSRTAEEFYFSINKRLDLVEQGKLPPFIELLDSMDALSTDYESDKFQEASKAHDKGTEAKGDYGDGKAKINSRWIRSLIPRLRDTGSILIILSQTRDNVGGGLFDPKSVHAGGRALKFYATWQLWSSQGKKLTKEVNGKPRQLGIISRVTIKKNRLTGKEWTVEIPIYHSTGIDDIGSCVDFLVSEKRWSRSGQKIDAKEFKFLGNRTKLIKHIEDNKLEFDLRDLVAEAWRKVEQACYIDRKNRYE